jgi:hypothetical protein
MPFRSPLGTAISATSSVSITTDTIVSLLLSRCIYVSVTSNMSQYVCLIKFPLCDAYTSFVCRSTHQHPLPGEIAHDVPSGFSVEGTPLETSHTASFSSLRGEEEDANGKIFSLCIS